MDTGMQGAGFIFISQNGFVYALEVFSFADRTGTFLGQVINTKDHILGRYGYRSAIGRLQQVVGRQQHETALCLCFLRKRKVYSHLVTIEVGVERGTNKGMQLDRLTFYKDRLKCLDTQSVQCRCTVQHNRMLFDDIFQNVPNLRIQPFYQLLRIFDVLGNASAYQLLHYKGLEQLDCHFLRKTALINFQFGTNDDNGTSGIVNTLS